MSETELLVGGVARKPKKERWYDPLRVTLTLFGLVGFFVLAWGGFVFALSYNATTANTRQDAEIKAIGEKLGTIDKKQDRADDKLDRVLERLPK